MLSLALAILAGPAPADAPPSSRWLTDLRLAEQVAKRSCRPIFVVFRCEH